MFGVHKFGIVIIIFLATAPAAVFAVTGTIDDTRKYAWSENYGWINFKADSSNVVVSDSKLTGHAWNKNTGWINLAPSGSVFVANNGSGTLSGHAWGEGIGYINFSGVTIDFDGYFHGYATTDSGSQISFNCANTSSCASSDFKVRTSWRQSSTGGGGGGGGGWISYACDDKKDNDGDGFIDMEDPGCDTIFDNDETHEETVATSTENAVATPTPSCMLVAPHYPFITHDLSFGDEDAQVVSLQRFLNTNGFILTRSGWGAHGKETLYFGPLTHNALIRFQEEYADRGLLSERGILGPQTRILINSFREEERPPLSEDRLLCEPIQCRPYIVSYIHRYRENDELEVRKLQDFLREHEGYQVETTGKYDDSTYRTVHVFQTKYADDILTPWKIIASTGYVYKTTSQKINDLYCFYTKGLTR